LVNLAQVFDRGIDQCRSSKHLLKILFIGQKHSKRLFPIPTCSASFLVIVFEIFRQVTVDDNPHIRLVNPHPKGIGTDHHPYLVIFPSFLLGRAIGTGHACVIGSCRNPHLIECFGELLRTLAISHIPDRCTGNSIEDFCSFFKFVFDDSDTVAQIFSGKTLVKLPESGHFQLFQNILTHLRSRRSRQGNHIYLGVKGANLGDFEVGRTKIIAPLGNTMGLVNCDQIDIHLLESLDENLCFQTLRRNVEKLEVTIDTVVQYRIDLAKAHPRINRYGFDPTCFQVIDLIFHQSNQRRNDQANPFFGQSGNLVTKAFSSSSG